MTVWECASEAEMSSSPVLQIYRCVYVGLIVFLYILSLLMQLSHESLPFSRAENAHTYELSFFLIFLI